MKLSDCFDVEPWALREKRFDLELLGETESIFALANGHIGWRANLDEGEPHVIAGSYLNAFYEAVPLPYAETAYGYPEAGQALVSVTDGKIIRLLVNDEPFDIRYGKLISHERVLDMRTGLLERVVEWESPAHKAVRVRSTRMVSLAHRAIAAIRYEVEPLDGPADIVLQSELLAKVTGAPAAGREDPRAGSPPESPLEHEYHGQRELRAVLIHRTRSSNLRVAAGMDHEISAPRGTRIAVMCGENHARITLTARVEAGRPLRLVKYVAYGWSGERSVQALRAQVDGALAAAMHDGWRGLVSAQKAYLQEFWNRADVELEGDLQLQQAIRFALFHVLQSSARAEQRAIPAKGLTGPGYDGHTFWDTETFVLPALIYTVPEAAADVLRWRHQILDLARDRARDLGLKGAAFPWRTIHGEECSGYWPASTAAFHINADIADGVLRYTSAADDATFEAEHGAELLIETARLWASLGHFDRAGRFRIDGVTGPDEYSALADNNLYTNLMAQRNLRAAAGAVGRQASVGRRLKVSRGEVTSWRKAADAMFIPYNGDLGIHEQASQFTEHEAWDFSRCKPEDYPLFLHFPYFDLYRKQVVKQADLVLAMHLRGDAFTHEEKVRNFAYYDPITVRDSSLSSSTQAIMAAEVGHLQLAYDYLGEAALMDLNDLEHNVREGVHMGSLAGAWQAAVAGLGGMRHHGDALGFAPRLPPAIERLTFRLMFRGRRIKVAVDQRNARYSLVSGRPLECTHHGEPIRLIKGRPTVRAIPDIRPGREPEQPPGREPARRQATKEKPQPLRRDRPAQRRRVGSASPSHDSANQPGHPASRDEGSSRKGALSPLRNKPRLRRRAAKSARRR
ncbi:MAG TPA: glycosyl hydrolase family 65 protein [Candidatus Dormibacteraeota bacterium]|nr:glycosyl hydrolase family 65 protein [Candidatus Dormibacteraeota bacterium]